MHTRTHTNTQTHTHTQRKLTLLLKHVHLAALVPREEEGCGDARCRSKFAPADGPAPNGRLGAAQWCGTGERRGEPRREQPEAVLEGNLGEL